VSAAPFPKRSVFSLDWTELPASDLRLDAAALQARTQAAEVAFLRTTPSGQAAIPYSPLIHLDDHALPYARAFMQKATHAWDAGYLTFVNRPVLLDLWFGSLYVKDASGLAIIEETLYVSGQRAARYFEDLKTDAGFAAASAGPTIGPGLDTEQFYVPLLNIQSGVYFHMISEALLQAYVLASLGLTSAVQAVVPRVRRPVADLAVTQSRSFGMPVIQAGTRFIWLPRAAFYSCFQQHARMNPDFRRMAEHLRLRHSPRSIREEIGIWRKAPLPGRRLYVSRAGASARPLQNEAELVDLAARHEFEIVDPGSLPFDDQVALFASASIVIGPHGAGLTNAAFCPSGSTLIEFRGLNRASQSPSRNETYRRLSACCGLHYGCLMFENAAGSDGWAIDIPMVERVLARLAAPKAG
jgi:hypothetical protein